MVEQGDIIYATIRGKLHGQRTISTFWYYAKDDNPGLEEAVAAGAFAVAWMLQFGTDWATPLSEEWTDGHLRTQLLRPQVGGAPLRWALAEVPLTTPDGVVAESALPSVVSAVCRRRTALAGRRYRGRVYVPGIPVTYESDSELTQAGYDALTTSIAPILIQTIVVQGTDFAPCITNSPQHTRITEVNAATFDPVLRVQRRREVGVGE